MRHAQQVAGVLLALIGLAGAALGQSLAELAAEEQRALAADRADAAYAESADLVGAGRIQEGLALVVEELEFEDLPREWLLYFLNRAAQLEIAIQRPGAALAHLDELEPLLGEELGDRRSLCFLFGVRGQVFLDWGLTDLAQHWFEREQLLADALWREGGSGRERRAAISHRASLLLAQENHPGLVPFVEQALVDPLFEEWPTLRAGLRMVLGYGLASAESIDPGRTPSAAGQLRQALADLGEGRSVEKVRPETVLAILAHGVGDDEAARGWLELAALHMGGDAAERGDAPGHTYWIAVSARLAIDAGASREELLSWNAILRHDYAELLARRRAVEPRPGGYGMLHFSDTRALLSELIRLALALHGREAGASAVLDLLVQAQRVSGLFRAVSSELAPDSPSALMAADGPDLAAIRATLLPRPRSGLLVYMPGPSCSHVVVIDDEFVDVVELAPAAVIESARVAVVDAVTRPLRPEEDGAASLRARRHLSALLLPEDVEQRVSRWARLTIVGRDLLGEVPFEALPLGDAPFLGISHAVVDLPSLPFGVALGHYAARRRDSGPIAWLMSSPTVGAAALSIAPDLGPVPLDEAQARELLEPYGSRVRLFAAEAATLAALDDPGLAEATVLQVFSHGVFDRLAERPASLLVSSADGHDGLLRARDIEQRIRPPASVLLTVCRTGRGPRRFGDPGAVDLSGAFLSRGARSVVLSSFDLDAEAARRLSNGFHRSLARGDSPAEAMRSARESLAADPRFADPFYHALLRVVGRGHDPLLLADPWWRSTGVLLLTWGALLACGSLLLRRRSRPAQAR